MRRLHGASYDRGVARARARKLSAERRRGAQLAELERRRYVLELAELAFWWDGPGSEGRCV